MSKEGGMGVREGGGVYSTVFQNANTYLLVYVLSEYITITPTLGLKLSVKNLCTAWINLKKFFKLAVSPYFALQHVQEVFPDMYSLNVLEINSQ